MGGFCCCCRSDESYDDEYTGFTKGGIIKGSEAARAQSRIGNVEKDSSFSRM